MEPFVPRVANECSCFPLHQLHAPHRQRPQIAAAGEQVAAVFRDVRGCGTFPHAFLVVGSEGMPGPGRLHVAGPFSFARLAADREQGPLCRRHLHLLGGRILSPAAGLRLLEARTQAWTQPAADGCHEWWRAEDDGERQTQTVFVDNACGAHKCRYCCDPHPCGNWIAPKDRGASSSVAA